MDHMDFEERQHRASLAAASGVAEQTYRGAEDLAIDIAVRFDGNFAVPLLKEVSEMKDRFKQISEDLIWLALSDDLKGYGDEIHRLANRGAEPADAKTDREQLEAIEGGRAAA